MLTCKALLLIKIQKPPQIGRRCKPQNYSHHFLIPPTVSLRTIVRGTSAKIPYWWLDTCSWLVGNLLQTITRTIQIWVVTSYLCGISELVLQTPSRGETVRSVAKCRLFLVHLNLAWENRRHSATLPTVSPRNDVWEASAEIPYWWRVSAKIWLMLLIGRAACEICFNQSEALLRSIWVVSRHQYGISTLVS